ncbi:MAG TPA: hypothetical protein VMW71_00805 [Thermoplasmata archaeon]|nr:hypothetical protein [Thermoplasmata archaeon]
MSQDIRQHVKADFDGIPSTVIFGLEGIDLAKSLVTHALLRVWTRMALTTGQKLRMSPSQYDLGIYKGKMNWILNEGGLEGVNRLEISGSHGRDYAVVGEVYELDGIARARILFSFQEDVVRGKPVFVSYLAYDQSAKDFDMAGLAGILGPAMSKWADTVSSGSEEPLWNYSKEHFECVGV